MKKQLSIRTMTSIAVLSAVAFVLAFFEFPVPLSPSFARMDLSDFPALIGAFAFGPVAGILIELVKNLLGLFSTSTGGVGELANFLMGASFAATAGLRKSQSSVPLLPSAAQRRKPRDTTSQTHVSAAEAAQRSARRTVLLQTAFRM